MNKKGFTLIELLAVIVIIAIIMTMIMPSASRVNRNNKKRIYSEYENMMIEYAKVSDLNNQNIINLDDLNELERVKDECDGYVQINHSVIPATYSAHIKCTDQYTSSVYDASLIN